MALIHYAGIGSRQTPDDVRGLMFRLGRRFAELGYTLRSGAADGADAAFESGCDAGNGPKEIWLPWDGFQSHLSPLRPSEGAFSMAKRLHPGWERLERGPRALHARNCHQILGADLATPVEFVICWTADCCESAATRSQKTGGTGLAIAVASQKNIPVFNLATADAMARLTALVETIKARPTEVEIAQTKEILTSDPFIQKLMAEMSATIVTCQLIK